MVLICAVMYCMAVVHLQEGIAYANLVPGTDDWSDWAMKSSIANEALQCNQTVFLTVNVLLIRISIQSQSAN